VKILASIFYGNIEIFAKINSEVSVSNYDFKTEQIQDILKLVRDMSNFFLKIPFRNQTKIKLLGK
jgi:hypothetical protein